ncbi:hypothetical protein KP509_22G068900 [Ceratopteris richardii]|uniref:U-box domain-containing protein n=2 Tax=Ceratopteris richardii TaxID=49495 RepID=A0A8T2S796_CERRI|nr:hypothetical protein KP509_22G068900 [Ceratopteris richardii]
MEQVDLEKDLDVLDLENVSVRSKQRLHELLRAVSYGCVETKIRAAYEVGMLAKSSAKRRAYLAAAGAITPLVSMLSSQSLEAQDASMEALLNLAVRHERNKLKIVKAGAVPVLVELLRQENANIRESAAAVILTLSASSEIKPIIGNSGAMVLLVGILLCGSIQGRVDAVMTLYNLSTYPDNLTPILNAGAISPLILLLKDCKKASKVAERTMALLQSLMVFEEGRSAVANEERGVLTLVEVLEEGSLQSREHAVTALLTMCQSSRCKYRQAILQEGVIPGLLELTVQGTASARQKAHSLLHLLRDPPRSPSSSSASVMSERIVSEITSHVETPDAVSVNVKKIVTDVALHNMEQNTSGVV